MDTFLTPQTHSEVIPGNGLSAAIDAARAYAGQATAANTLRAYCADWAAFTAWCEAHGVAAFSAAPETVALYLAASADAGLKVATIGRNWAVKGM